MKFILCLCLALATSLAFAGDSSADAKAVQGNWRPVTAELAGQPMPDAVLKTISLKLVYSSFVFAGVALLWIFVLLLLLPSLASTRVMKSKWPDFLFTIAVRSLFGMVVGLLISVPVIFLGRRKSPLVELVQAHRYEVVICWFALWGIGGAIVGIWTTPHWQRPWHKYKKWNGKDNDDIHVV